MEVLLASRLTRRRAEYSHPLYVKRMAAFTEEFDEGNREGENRAEAKIDSPVRKDVSPLALSPAENPRRSADNSAGAIVKNEQSKAQ